MTQPNHEDTPTPTDQPWLVRAYVPEVDDLRYLLGVSYTRSKAGVRAGASTAGKPGSRDQATIDAERAFLAAHAPIFEWLLENADVRLTCDPQRPEIIYAWTITSEPNVIHAIGAKHDVVKAGFATEMIEELLGDRRKKPQVVTLELPQVRRAWPDGTLPSIAIMSRPSSWTFDPTWLLIRMVGR